MKITTHKQLYILFTIISLITTGIVGFILKKNNLPYTFKLDKKELRTDTKKAFIYNDLNFDNKSEKIKLSSAFQKANNKTAPNDNIELFNSENAVVDQFNLYSYSSPSWLHFEDYNNDGYKEIFAFSQLNDSLFLSVINVKEKKFILNREFVLEKPDSAKKDFWDIWVQSLGLLNIKNKSKKELFFSIIGAYSIYPRSIYSYNVENKKITNKFETGSVLHPVEFCDLNNDGEQEIVNFTNATGNLSNKIGYHDYCNWLFVLDKNLKPVFKPKKIGSYPGSLSAYMVRDTNKRKLFCVSFELKNNKQISISLLFNTKGQLLDTLKYLPNNLRWPFKIVQNNQDFIIIPTKTGNLLKLNNKLQLIETKHSFSKTLHFISEIKYDLSQPKGIFAIDETNMVYIFDKSLNILASIKLDEQFNGLKGHYSTKINSPKTLVQLAIVGAENNYLFSIKENKIFTYLPLIVLATAILTFILVGILHILFSFISTYLKYFTYSLNKSSNGIALLNSSGKICYNNANIINYLNLNTNKIRKKHYNNIFQNSKDVLSAITYSFLSKKSVKKDIHIASHNYQFEGIVTITPFTSFIGFTPSYLMEITDFTAPLLTDRGKVWGATLQRIAHEIKTPLSTLILSLDNIKTLLNEKNVFVDDEINMMQAELERIKQLTKNFMMFTNLEKPNLVSISISEILNESINNFRSYFERGMKIIYDNIEQYVLGDKKQLSQLFSLIIENAIDACDGKGEIKIKTNIWKQESEKPFVKITISDNGKGMDEITVSKIFEPYFTTKKDGTGLGLSLVKKIIEDNKGKIEITSELNKGTTIIIYLPKAD